MKKLTEKKSLFSILYTILIFIFLLIVFFLNFSKNPYFYNGDMYADLDLAKEIWGSKSLFPPGWVFGNQVYIVATPVIAALFYGIFKDVLLAMAIASSLMTVLIIIVYNWMIKPYSSYLARQGGLIAMVTFVALFGHVLVVRSSWQLLFTMCSYYSCYLVTAMLCFGLYVRAVDNQKGKSRFFILPIACLLSFATGIQSLRQTLIMTIPLIVAEAIYVVFNIIKKKKINRQTLITTCLISVSNFAGVIFEKYIDYQKESIYGEFNLINTFDIRQIISETLTLLITCLNLGNNLVDYGKIIIPAIAVIGIVCALSIYIYLKGRKENSNAKALFIIIGISLIGLGGIVFLLLFSEMIIRDVYFFMIDLVVALLITNIIDSNKKKIRTSSIIIISILFAIVIPLRIVPTVKEINSKERVAVYCEAADLIEKNNCDSVIADWYIVGRIGAASDGKLRAGIHGYSDGEWEVATHICNLNVIKNPQKAMGVIWETELPVLLESAKEKKVDIEIIARTKAIATDYHAKEHLIVFKMSGPYWDN